MSQESGNNSKNLLYAGAALGALLLIGMIILFVKVTSLEKGGSKVGFIKSDALLAQYKPALAIQQKLQEETAPFQADLQKRYAELQTIGEELEKKSKVLSSAAMAPQMESFQRKQSEFYQLQQSLQQQVNQKQSQLMEPIFQDISTFIQKYGKDNGYTVILGTPVEGLIVYGETGQDLTETLLNELNSKVPPSMPVPFSGKDTTKK